MKKIIPHHSVISKNIFFFGNSPILIPELWLELDNVENISYCFNNKIIKTTDADTFQPKSEFVITNIEFFKWLKQTSFLSYTIFSEESYFDDLPIFFQDEWAEDINTDLMTIVGWTVNKFTEPACFFGFFPIQFTVNKQNMIEKSTIIDDSILNQFGLIDNYQNAKIIADFNTSEDHYDEVWRPLAVCVDKFTLKKVNLLIENKQADQSRLN